MLNSTQTFHRKGIFLGFHRKINLSTKIGERVIVNPPLHHNYTNIKYIYIYIYNIYIYTFTYVCIYNIHDIYTGKTGYWFVTAVLKEQNLFFKICFL